MKVRECLRRRARRMGVYDHDAGRCNCPRQRRWACSPRRQGCCPSRPRRRRRACGPRRIGARFEPRSEGGCGLEEPSLGGGRLVARNVRGLRRGRRAAGDVTTRYEDDLPTYTPCQFQGTRNMGPLTLIIIVPGHVIVAGGSWWQGSRRGRGALAARRRGPSSQPSEGVS